MKENLPPKHREVSSSKREISQHADEMVHRLGRENSLNIQINSKLKIIRVCLSNDQDLWFAWRHRTFDGRSLFSVLRAQVCLLFFYFVSCDLHQAVPGQQSTLQFLVDVVWREWKHYFELRSARQFTTGTCGSYSLSNWIWETSDEDASPPSEMLLIECRDIRSSAHRMADECVRDERTNGCLFVFCLDVLMRSIHSKEVDIFICRQLLQQK